MGRVPSPANIGGLERWPIWALEPLRWGATNGQCLYMIGTNGSDYIKIGIARDVFGRRDTLQTGNPFELVPVLTLHGSIALERRFHKALKDFHVRGEWFRVGPWFDEVTAWGSNPDRDTVFAWLKERGA
jgi:hypothetical protein